MTWQNYNVERNRSVWSRVKELLSFVVPEGLLDASGSSQKIDTWTVTQGCSL